MMTKRLALLLLVASFLFNLACLPISTKTSTGPSSDKNGPKNTLAAAETAYNQGQFRIAADYYKQYLQATPNPPQLESILASYGLSAEKAGQFSEAVAVYDRLTREFPSGALAKDIQPRLAAVYLVSGEALKAESLAKSLLASETDPTKKAGLELTIAQSQWAQNRFSEAAGNFLNVWRMASGPIKTSAEEGVLACLAKLDLASVEKIQRQYGQNFPGPEATYLLVHKTAASGDKARTMALVEYFNQYFSSNPLMPQVAAVANAVNTPGGTLPPLAFGANYDPRSSLTSTLTAPTAMASMGQLSSIGNVSIAVILPLGSNSASKYAQEILSGLKLAISSFSAAGSVGLKVMDTKGSPEEATRLVKEAATDPKVLAIIGPFLSREATLAAETANQAGLPIIAISQKADLTNIGANVFRLFLTPKHQAEAVARYTVQVKGNRALGILYPDDNFGQPIRTYFENEARRLGAQVTVAEGYPPTGADWSEVVGRLTGGEKAARKVSASYQAQTSFTALYLPDTSAAVSQLLAQLAFNDITKMQYLGSPLWINQEFLTNSSRYIQGSVIPVAISELSLREESRRFITGYQTAYGQIPDQFAAYGYDAGLAVIKALGQGADTRDKVRQALVQGDPIPGATGPFSFDGNGEYVIDPTLLSVGGKNFILLREAAPGAR